MNILKAAKAVKLPVKLTRTIGRATIALRSHAPEILTGGGVIAVVGCVITSCRATLQIGDILDDARDRIDAHKNLVEHGEREPDDTKRELAKVYADTGVQIAGLYLLPFALGTGGVCMILGSHHILRKENAVLSAAYMALSESYNSYRQRVREDQGADKDMEYYMGTHKEKIFVVGDDGDGEEREVTIVDTNTISPYARFFDIGNRNFVPNRPEANLMFLRRMQCIANDKLRANGHLFLNEVYDLLGIPRSEEGQKVGWVDGAGDNFVDFGIYDLTSLPVRNFVNGFEEAILLDFNVDGPIMWIFQNMQDYKYAIEKE